MRFIILLTLCLGILDVKNAGCHAACISHKYDDGKSDGKKGCICIVKEDDFEFMIRGQINLGDLSQREADPSVEKKHSYFDY